MTDTAVEARAPEVHGRGNTTAKNAAGRAALGEHQRSFVLVRPAWALSCGCKSRRKETILIEANRARGTVDLARVLHAHVGVVLSTDGRAILKIAVSSALKNFALLTHQ